MNIRPILFEEPPHYLLLSLREGPYNEIVCGIKKYEYRTRYPKEPTIAFIYVSQKVKAIRAVIEFEAPIIGSEEEISQMADQIKPGSYEGIMEYFKHRNGYAIPIKKIIEFEPILLDELRDRFPGFVVPQSYYLLERKEELLKFLLERVKR